MELNQTKKNLELLERQDEISLEDALNLVYDFFGEVRKTTGRSLEKMPAQDIDGLFRRLPWLLRASVNMVETNQSRILDPKRKEKLRQRREELSEAERAVEDERNTIEALSEKEKRLSLKKAELEKARRRETELQKICDNLREEISSLEHSSLEELEREVKACTAQKEDLLARIFEARRGVEKIRQECREQEQELMRQQKCAGEEKEKTDSVRLSLQETDHKISAEKENRAILEAQLKNETEELGKEKEKTVARIRDAEDRLASQKSALEDARADLSTLEAQIGIVEETTRNTEEQNRRAEESLRDKSRLKVEVQEHAAELNSRIGELDESIRTLSEQSAVLQSRINTLEEIRTEQQDKKDALDAKVASVNKTCERLREEIRLLEQDIERKDYSAQEQRLRKRKEETQEELRKFDALCRETEKQEQELTKTRQDVNAQENLLTEINQSIVQCETRRNSLIETVHTQENRLRTLETWLEGLEAEQYQKRCEELSVRVCAMEEIRKKVEEDWFSDWRRENLDLHDTYEYAADALRRNLSDMNEHLSRYREVLRSVIQCMESRNFRN